DLGSLKIGSLKNRHGSRTAAPVCAARGVGVRLFAMRRLIAAVFTLCFGLGSLFAIAQSPAAQPSPAAPKSSAPNATAPSSTAKPGDVDSIDHIIAAVYDVISGPAGPRDWDRFRTFFYPGARLIPSRRDDKGVVT